MATDTKDTTQEEHVQRIKAKYTILVEGLSCFQDVVSIMYEKRMLTQKEKEQILKFVQSCELYSASERLLEIVMSGPIEVYNCFLEALQETRQKDVYSMLVNKNKSLSKEEENALPHNRIRGIYKWLTENLGLDCDLLSHLYAERVLTESEFDKFAMNIRVSDSEKVHLLLSIIGRKSYDDFATFIQLLEKTNQAHVSKKLLKPMSFQTQKQEKQINHSSFDKHCKRNALTARRLWDAMKITNRMEEDLNEPDDNTHETEISTKVLSLQRKAKILSDDIIQDCIKQLLQDMDLAKKECVQAKGDYNRLHTELDQSREALKRTKRQNATNKDDARLKQSYEQMRKDAKLIGIIKTKAAKKSNKAVWGVTILENKMYVVSRWTPEVEVFETVKFTCINRCTLDGLHNPEDIRASVKGKRLFIMDATRPAKAKEILRVEPNGMKVAVKWEIGDHEAILSVTEESNVIATVYENHQLIEYTSDGEEVHRIDLSNTGMMHPWHTIKLTNGHFLVCHGHYDEPLHRVCEIDHNGLILKSYADAANVHNLDVPANLAVDKFGSIILADYNNGVILLLNSDLECRKVLLSKEFGIRRPARLHLDEENGRLLIADNEMGWKNGRVLVFEITKYKFKASPLITRLIKNNCRITTCD